MKSLDRLVALVCTGQLARDRIERADHRHFFGLSRRRHAQVSAALGPRPRQIRVCQGLALVAIEENDVAGLGLGLAQLKAQALRARSRRRFGGLSACAGAAASGSFFSQRLGQLRSADPDALARLDLGDEARNRPIGSVGERVANRGRSSVVCFDVQNPNFSFRPTRNMTPTLDAPSSSPSTLCRTVRSGAAFCSLPVAIWLVHARRCPRRNFLA